MSGGISFDAVQKRRFVNLIRQRTPPAHAAEILGFRYSTVKRHLKDDAEFRQQVEDVQELIIQAVENVVLEEALDGNMAAVKMFLHNRAGDRWRDEQTIRRELTGPNGGPIQLVHAHTLALREVLTDPTTHQAAIAMVRELPSAATAIIEAELADDD